MVVPWSSSNAERCLPWVEENHRAPKLQALTVLFEVAPMTLIKTGRLIASSLPLVFALWALAPLSESQELRFEFTPPNTVIRFTLGDILHTIHGSFRLKQGEVEYDPATGAVHGVLVIDASSGQSGNRTRDRKMHREVLESGRYPEISFRSDRVDPKLAASGRSTVQVHGTVAIHGSEHALTVPVEVDIQPDRWAADAHFTIPYVNWGMKNPSTFFLRVSESVEIDFHASGASAARTP
jgi:polyisoprenoid-binding protein YceI